MISFDGRIDKAGYSELINGGLFADIIRASPCEIRKGKWLNGPAYMLWREDSECGAVIHVPANRAADVESRIAAGDFSDFNKADLSALLAEFQQSHLSIDDFVKQKLSAEFSDGEAKSRKLLEMFAAVDRNFKDLQSAKAKGINRQEWLRTVIDGKIKELNLGGKRAEIGAALDGAISGADAVGEEESAARPFDGIDAVDIVSDIDRKIVEAVGKSMTVGKEMQK